jgi:hypothetical protein
MSLSTQIALAVEQAFVACGDLVGSFTISRTVITYDPLSGESVETASSFTAKGVIDKDSSKFTMFTTVEADQFRIWLKSSIEPKIDDQIALPDNSLHRIVDVKSVKPYNVAFIYELLVK